MGSILGWGSKIPHATEQLSTQATARRVHALQCKIPHDARKIPCAPVLAGQPSILLSLGFSAQDPCVLLFSRSSICGPWATHSESGGWSNIFLFCCCAVSFWMGRQAPLLVLCLFSTLPLMLTPQKPAPLHPSHTFCLQASGIHLQSAFAVVLILLKAEGSFERKASVLLILTALKMNVLDNLLLKAKL